MADKNIPLSIVSCTRNESYWSTMGIGSEILTQQPKHWGYWFVILDRGSAKVVYNQIHAASNSVPDLDNYNNSDHILALATLGVGLNNQPQGELFKFLDLNGAGQQLRHIDQIATQFNCGSLGTFGYALVGVLGNQNLPGFEVSQITSPPTGPILTVQLMPVNVGDKTVYTPVQLSNA